MGFFLWWGQAKCNSEMLSQPDLKDAARENRELTESTLATVAGSGALKTLQLAKNRSINSFLASVGIGFLAHFQNMYYQL